MLGICFFTLGENTSKAPLQEGEKGVDPEDLKPVIEPLAERSDRVPEELAPAQDEQAIEPGQ